MGVVYIYQDTNDTEEILRNKMKKWGILRDEELLYSRSFVIPAVKIDLFDYLFKNSRLIGDERVDIEEKVKSLESTCRKHERRIIELERALGTRREITKADLVYMKYKDQLEKDHFGAIVAIDTDLGVIAGIGDTILEAYEQAKEKSVRNKFSYKRVGYGSVYRLV